MQNFMNFLHIHESLMLFFFSPPRHQKCDIEDLHPVHLMLLLDASGGQEVFCMSHLNFLPFFTFGLASFCCRWCRNKLGVFSTVLGVHGGPGLVPTGLF